MLTISNPMKGPHGAKYYAALVENEEAKLWREKPGVWHGEGAQLLNLKGTVSPKVLREVLAGFSPDGKEKLVNNAGTKSRQRGWDLTFSAPKSVSVLWAMSSPEYREKISKIHTEAVKDALEYLQEKAAVARRGQGGKVRERASLVFALFEHSYSRSLDPQLHTHSLLVNTAVRPDNTTGSIHSKDIFIHRRAAGLVYQASFRIRLQAELSVLTEDKAPAFHVIGVPVELCGIFSKRRKAIREYMVKHGLHGAAAAKIAALATRPKKKNVSAEELFTHWQRIGETYGWGPKEAKRLLERESQSKDSTDKSSSTAKAESQSNSSGSSTSNNKGQTSDSTFQSRKDASKKRKHRASPLPQKRWQKIIWEKSIGPLKVRLQVRQVIPGLHRRNPFSKARLPALRVTIRNLPFPDEVRRRRVLKEKNLKVAKLQLVRKQLFPFASWGRARRAHICYLRFSRKSALSNAEKKTAQTDKKTQNTKQTQSF